MFFVSVVGIAIFKIFESNPAEGPAIPQVPTTDSGPKRGIPVPTFHPSSDKEIDERHALCFIAHLQGLEPLDEHCRQHGVDYDERGDFWAL